MIVVNSSTRQFSIPGADLVFGVTADSGSERKYFQCPRYVGDNLDIAGSFVRMNYRNANGEIDSYLVDDLTVDGNNVTFTWKLSPKATAYKGNISFVMCVVGADTKVAWHTTLGRGQVLEGLEPDSAMIEGGTADVVAALITMVEAQTAAVEAEGAKQIKAVQTAAEAAEAAAVAEIEAKSVNVRESIPDDYTALSEAVDSLTRGRAGAIVCEAAGSAVSVNDASDLPMLGMRIFGRSTQDGVPSPEAPVEIKSVENPVVTVCGKNIFGGEALADKIVMEVPYATKNTVDKTVQYSSTYVSGKTLFTSFKENTQYTFILKGKCVDESRNNLNLKIRYTDDTETQMFGTIGEVATIVIVSDAGKTISGLIGSWMYSSTVLYYEDCGVFEGVLTAAEYEPYSSQTLATTHTLPGIPVTSGGNYTDSDGQQWICDEVDMERGVYVQRTQMCFVDMAFTADSSGLFRSKTVLPQPITSYPYLFSNRFIRAESYSALEKGDLAIGVNGSGSLLVKYDMFGDDVNGFNQWVKDNSVYVSYIMATPIETPLSETEIAAYRALHSNYPNTTVLNDAGAHMVVKYAADTKLYIDNKIAALIGG